MKSINSMMEYIEQANVRIREAQSDKRQLEYTLIRELVDTKQYQFIQLNMTNLRQGFRNGCLDE